ncbi:hypothetical protein RCL1_006263 [Eukaryota sp. TZLM3-RCL]
MFSLFSQLSRVFEPKNYNVVLLGCSGAGKTLICDHVKRALRGTPSNAPLNRTIPSYGLNLHLFPHPTNTKVRLRLWDLPGENSFSSTWSSYAKKAHGLCFVVSFDTINNEDCLSILSSIFSNLSKCPILIVLTSFNDVDDDFFLNFSTICLSKDLLNHNAPVSCNRVNLTTGKGVKEILSWFFEHFSLGVRDVEE